MIRSRNIACVLWVAALPVFAGCAMSAAGREKIKAASAKYESGDVPGAKTEADAVLKEFPSAPESAEAFYIRGLANMRQSNRGSAKADLRKCVLMSKRPDLTARAHATLGEIAFDEEDFATASQEFGLSLKDMKEEPPADEIRYRYGVSLQREAKWAEAREQFAFLLHRYKGGRHPEDVRRRFSWPADAFAIQAGVFQQEASAQALVKSLGAAGLTARDAFEGRGGVPLHVVYVGKYATYAQAREALPAVRKQVPDAQIVP